MILNDFKIFPKKGCVLGLDWGQKRIGVAISDFQQEFVFPRPVCVRFSREEQLKFIADCVEIEKIVAIIIGLPLYSDGTESKTTISVRQFVCDLEQMVKTPIYFIEENLTSYEAQSKMEKFSVKKIKQELDSLSAKIILENALSMVKRI